MIGPAKAVSRPRKTLGQRRRLRPRRGRVVPWESLAMLRHGRPVRPTRRATGVFPAGNAARTPRAASRRRRSGCPPTVMAVRLTILVLAMVGTGRARPVRRGRRTLSPLPPSFRRWTPSEPPMSFLAPRRLTGVVAGPPVTLTHVGAVRVIRTARTPRAIRRVIPTPRTTRRVIRTARTPRRSLGETPASRLWTVGGRSMTRRRGVAVVWIPGIAAT